jgi:hypothetical protein
VFHMLFFIFGVNKDIMNEDHDELSSFMKTEFIRYIK